LIRSRLSIRIKPPPKAIIIGLGALTSATIGYATHPLGNRWDSALAFSIAGGALTLGGIKLAPTLLPILTKKISPAIAMPIIGGLAGAGVGYFKILLAISGARL